MGIKLDTKTKTYTVQYQKRHPVTRQPIPMRRTRIKTLAEAKRVERELIVLVEEKLRKTIVPTWSAVLAEYFELARQRGLSSKTIYSWEKCLNAHVNPAWQERLIDTITTTEITSLIATRLSKHGQTYQKYLLRTIRSVFAHAIESGKIVRNPTPNMKFKSNDRILPVLTEAQATRLLECAREINCEWYPHWSAALYTGMRSGELHALTWDNVNLEAKTIVVNASWNNVEGIKSTKSGDHRLVEIADGLMPVLRELRAKFPEAEFVLPRNERWDKGRQAHDLRMFLAGMGLPSIRFHDLRASWATMLLGKGVAPIKVMSMGGWKQMETMMIYVRKAGIDVRGSLEGFSFHQHEIKQAAVLNFSRK